MAFIDIKTYPDPVLRKVAAPIEDISAELRKLSEDMVETMCLSKGAGLAANQVGVPVRLIVIDSSLSKGKETIILINPTILEMDSEVVSEEGCLSLPKYYEFVKRAQKVLARGTTLKEQTVEIECEGQLARAFQHEIDHLNGVLLIDHLSPVKKGLFKKRYQKDRR